MEMKTARWSIIALVLASLIHPCAALSNVDVTGTWESRYNFGLIEEVMTANILQVGSEIIGSYSVEILPSGDEYSGIIFGTVDGDEIKAFYLAIKGADGSNPLTTISFTDGVAIKDDKIRGEFYYRDSDLLELSGAYEADRV
ncbi:hypothetical protein [Methanocrinis sp.]|uniref:hypothetical protein n=1 Tax=Methanocrinis sp. TaxID=3101522 RepID=UPI003D1100FB